MTFLISLIFSNPARSVWSVPSISEAVLDSDYQYFNGTIKVLKMVLESLAVTYCRFTVASRCYGTPQILISDFINFRENQE